MHLPPPVSTVSAPSARLRRVGAVLACSLGAWALLVGLAQAAPVGAPADSAAASPPAARTLDKALGGDVSTGDRNLDLLLDAQRKGLTTLDDAPAPGKMPERRPSDRLASQPLPDPQRTQDAQRPAPVAPLAAPLALPATAASANSAVLAPGPVLPSAGPAAPPKLKRDWSGQGAVGATTATGQGGKVGMPGARLADLLGLMDAIQIGLAFIHEHLIALVSGGAALLLTLLGLKSYSRRP